MSLDRSAIYIAAQSYAEYSNGLALFKEKKAKIFGQTGDISSYISFNGVVRCNDKSFYTTTSANSDMFFSGSCSCGCTFRGLCAHQVAVSLCWLDKYDKDINDMVITDHSFKLMMKGYREKIDEISSEDDSVSDIIHICPVIMMEADTLSFGLKIGTDKLYSARNLIEIFDCYKNNSCYYAGKTNAVRINEKNIFSEDIPLFRFFIKIAEQRFKNRNLVSGNVKSLSLGRSERDEFFQICSHKNIRIENFDLKIDSTVEPGDPKLKFLIAPEKDDGIRLLPATESFRVCMGENRIYILWDDIVYVCSDELSDSCGLFLEAIGKIMDGGKKYVVISMNDIPEFCTMVVPFIEKFIILDDKSFPLNSYKAEKLDALFYFDMPDDDTLTCEVKFKYGQNVFNPLTSDGDDIARNKLKEGRIERFIGNYFHFKNTENKLIIQNNDEKIYDVLSKGITEFMEYGDVFVSDSIKSVRVKVKPKVSVGVSVHGDLLNLKIDADGLTSDELRDFLAGYKAKKRFFRLKNGDYINYEDIGANSGIDALDELVDGLRIKNKSFSEDINLPKNRAFYIDKVLKDSNVTYSNIDDNYRNIIRSIEPGAKKDYDIPDGINAKLREYQKEGYCWMRSLQEYGFGGILADDMGLGKTLQVITLILSLRADDRTSLVCCPASLVYNWYSEFIKFAPSLKCEILQGEQSDRAEIIKNYLDADVLITSYDVLRRDIELYNDCHFFLQIVDEAQFIKNQNAKKSHAVKEIDASTRFALTGTPIENRLSELWSIFDYLMPGYLYSYQMFKAIIETPIVKEHDKQTLERLHKLIAPFILRRLKKDVLNDLPDKMEEVVYAQLEGEQKTLYAAVASRLMSSIKDSSDDAYNIGKIQVLAELTRLRQLCCDPSLVYENYSAGSVKLNACMELVEQGMDGGHKMLIFSQFTSMLKIIQDELEKENIKYYILTGETPAKERLMLVDSFQNDETPVFLISLKAGGTGLNLTAADIVIHFDPWWNIAAQNQATDRSHRIGQSNKVSVYKLIAKDTIEDRIMQLQETKMQLAEDILGGEHISISSLGKEDILELLK